ncbi:hypothetical protein [Pararhizobium haloflavum]|uniref:hypothetical protein n=1 Tax=Pararhizobium haloflavum TaxID=2037914 RepID=UPI0018E42422|nr:hypothetical protein [Pararhizobium haloflavum]
MRIVIALLGIGLGALILYAFQTGDFGAAGSFLLADPWGRVTLADLYLGLVIGAVIIALFERGVVPTVAWCLPLPFLGNLWLVVWIVARWPRLRAALAGASSDSRGG